MFRKLLVIPLLALNVAAADAANGPPTPPALPTSPYTKRVLIQRSEFAIAGTGGGRLLGITSITLTNCYALFVPTVLTNSSVGVTVTGFQQ